MLIMKLTKSKLKQIIQEELKAVLSESDQLDELVDQGSCVKKCVEKHKGHPMKIARCSFECATQKHTKKD